METVFDHYRSKSMDQNQAAEAFDQLIEDAEAQATQANEMDFVASVRDRFDRYGVRAFCSVKQFEWLNKIAGYDDDLNLGVDR